MRVAVSSIFSRRKTGRSPTPHATGNDSHSEDLSPRSELASDAEGRTPPPSLPAARSSRFHQGGNRAAPSQSVEPRKRAPRSLRIKRTQLQPDTEPDRRTLAISSGVVCVVDPLTNYRLVSRRSYIRSIQDACSAALDVAASAPSLSQSPALSPPPSLTSSSQPSWSTFSPSSSSVAFLLDSRSSADLSLSPRSSQPAVPASLARVFAPAAAASRSDLHSHPSTHPSSHSSCDPSIDPSVSSSDAPQPAPNFTAVPQSPASTAIRRAFLARSDRLVRIPIDSESSDDSAQPHASSQPVLSYQPLAASQPPPASESPTASEPMPAPQTPDVVAATDASAASPAGSSREEALLKRLKILECQLKYRELQLGAKAEEDVGVLQRTLPPSSCAGTMHQHRRDVFLPIVAWLANLALLSYLSPLAVHDVLYGLWPSHGLPQPGGLEFFGNPATDTWAFGYCHPAHKEAAIVFRGTVSDENWSTNLDFKLCPLTPMLGEDPKHYPQGYADILVHQGFNRAFLSVWPLVLQFINECRTTMGNDTHFALCGHSLGGALASLCYLYLIAFFPDISIDQGMFVKKKKISKNSKNIQKNIKKISKKILIN